MRNELDLFRRLFDDSFLGQERVWSPASTVEESEGNYLLSVDMPGVARKDIKMEFQNDILSVTGERKEYGQFQRTFKLPSDVDAAKIEAAYVDGVLRIAIPKSEAAKPRMISLSDDNKASGLLSKWFGAEKKAEKEIHIA